MKEVEKGNLEFVSIMALMMSFVALAIDIMLPALDQIGASFNVINPNYNQLTISILFVGMAIGLIVFGPLSDRFGRKPIILIGAFIFIIGCLVSLYAPTFEYMLLGRALQGLGGAASRNIIVAMIRDQYSGTAMAKIMSFIFMIFILVPVFAPIVGQLILSFGDWRDIYFFMIALSFLASLWFYLRQPETLTEDHRIPLNIKNLKHGTLETLKNKSSRYYMLAAGFIFGAFIAYLGASQQIIQLQFGAGEKFPYIFGVLALCIGASSISNSKLLERYSMESLVHVGLKINIISAIVYLCVYNFVLSDPNLYVFLTYLGFSFFGIGLLMGNFNALALQPLGHIAGIANSVISSIQTFLSAMIAAYVGSQYDGTEQPLVLAFLLCSCLAVFCLIGVPRQKVDSSDG
ncbi:MAG: multidrug effflux MFS transporter [Bdellovibrionales bacterium]